MNPVPFTDPLSAAAVSKHKKCALYAWASSALKIRIIREDTANSAHRQKCGNC